MVIVGTQWGDEGKGKVTDFYASYVDMVVRFQGGNNAGHTIIVNGQEYKLHLLPSGIMHPTKVVVLGNGMVIDPKVFIDEYETIRTRLSTVAKVIISPRASVIMPYHILFDYLEEALRGDSKIGTTKRGIGPCYADKVARCGFHISDLLKPQTFMEKLKTVVLKKRAIAHAYIDLIKEMGLEHVDLDNLEAMVDRALDIDTVYEEYIGYGNYFRTHNLIADVTNIVGNALANGKWVLFEGAQGTLLDIDHGTYPFVTSSNTVAPMASIGTGVGMQYLEDVIGVVKAYTTRVGEGYFPTEIKDRTGEIIGKRGGEYGTTTGRKRRVGWLDLVALRYAKEVNSLTSIALTKLDTLCDLDEIKVCVEYDIEGRKYKKLPSYPDAMAKARPLYKHFDAWPQSEIEQLKTLRIRRIDELPPRLGAYIKYIIKEMNVSLALLSFGADRNATIDFKGIASSVR